MRQNARLPSSADTDSTPQNDRLVQYALCLVRQRAEPRIQDCSMTTAELEKAVAAKRETFARMSAHELATKLLLDLPDSYFHSDSRKNS